jgi:serine O-acetyltransferase
VCHFNFRISWRVGGPRGTLWNMDFRGLQDIIRADHAAKGKRSDRLTVDIFRVGQFTHEKKSRFFLHLAYRLIDMVWTRMIVGAELPPTVKAGPGLRLRHWGRGIIFHPATIIGDNAFIYHRVTIGVSKNGIPTVGNDVYVGAGATIIGDLHVGDRVKIGAGAVLTKSVPDDSTVVGSSARVFSSIPD